MGKYYRRKKKLFFLRKYVNNRNRKNLWRSYRRKQGDKLVRKIGSEAIMQSASKHSPVKKLLKYVVIKVC